MARRRVAAGSRVMQLDDLAQAELLVSELSWFIRDCIDHHAECVQITDLTQIMGHAEEGRTHGEFYRPHLSKVDIQDIHARRKRRH
jgi:hypothetical protein